MTKKRRSSAGCSCFGLFVLLLILALAGVIAGFYIVQNESLIDLLRGEEEAVDVIQRINPDVTQIPASAGAVTPDSAPQATTFVDLLGDVNGLRASRGLPQLRYDERLNRAAAVHASYMASTQNVRHEDDAGNTVDDRVSAQGYDWQSVGENLLANWSLDGHEAYQLWFDSPAHYDNLVDPDYTEIGLAYVVSPIGRVFHVMVLAHPR